MDSRRDFIKKAALLTGSMGLPNVFSMSLQKAMAINPAPGSTFYDAEHVVFLMQENRSFDHMFGSLKGVRGFNDPRIKTLPNGNKAWLQNDEKGHTYAPFHVDINKTKITWQGGLPHSWSDQVAARNKGKYDKWIPVKSLMTMAYYKREDIPFYYALADAFTICDHHFCSSLTGTTPNRLFFWTGNVRSSQPNAIPVVNNSQAESRDDVYVDWETFPELLEDHGVSWKVYQNELWTSRLPEGDVDDWLGNYGDNPLEYVKKHQVKLSAYFRKNGDQNSKLSAEEVLRKYNELSQREKNLIDKAFSTNVESPDYLKLEPFNYTAENGKQEQVNLPAGDIFSSFRNDVDHGKLPMVSWLVAPQRFSDHTSSPLYGTWYVSEAIDILTKNPEVWKKTIFILTYDENDGYFDHLPPFVPPKPGQPLTGKVSEGIAVESDYELKKDSPIGLGYRVPMVVASPWSKGGFVNSQVFDHTSSLMFLEKFLQKKTGKAIKSSTISSWRRAVCGDLTSVFRPYHGEANHIPDRLKKERVVTQIQQAKNKPPQLTPEALNKVQVEKINAHLPFHPEVSSFVAQQEKGVKPACAIPYLLTVNGKLNKENNSFMVSFSADKPAFQNLEPIGAPFLVYADVKYNGETGRNWAFAIAAGEKLTESWAVNNFENGSYDLIINGPNGFYRRFKGTEQDLAIDFNCIAERSGVLKKYTGNLQLLIENEEDKSIKVKITDNAYRMNHKTILIEAKQEKIVTLNLQKSKGWYDFTISCDENKLMVKQYAGHVETGQESITDPLMGGILSL
jgi:phospholipase C